MLKFCDLFSLGGIHDSMSYQLHVCNRRQLKRMPIRLFARLQSVYGNYLWKHLFVATVIVKKQ